MGMQLLGGLSPEKFLARFWQKKPFFVRSAIPGFDGVVQTPELFALASRADVESRLVMRHGGRWRLRHGPFARSEFARLPARRWTLLVQGLNLVQPRADRLLRRFDFLPLARLDDLMVSYAVPEGGVGPHVDSYDVFLLQGPGRRRWRIAPPGREEWDPRAPIRILRRFQPHSEWTLAPGDLLYLPPGWAHEGVALEPCFTYSVGFRAPSNQELAREFLGFLAERVSVRGRYRDPGLSPARHPARIPDAMLRSAEATAARIRWSRSEVAEFLGCYLSEPKPHVAFDRPRRALAPARFAELVRRRGVRLDLRTQMLFRGRQFFVNGEPLAAAASLRSALIALADRRRLPGARISAALAGLLHRWYLYGWLHPGEDDGTD